MFESVARKLASIPAPLALLVNGRLMLCFSMLAVPKLVMRIFGMGDQHNAAPAFARMFGIRNGFLGLGLLNLWSAPNPRRLLVANIVIDAVDAAAFLDAGRRGEFSRTSTVMSTTVALSAVALGALSLSSVPNQQD